MDSNDRKLSHQNNNGFLQGLGLKGHFINYLNNFTKKNSLCVTSLLDGNVTSTSTSVKRQFSLAEVSEHCHIESCWLVLSDKVYDVTKFLSSHPGGEEIILENAGTDATIPFESKGHSLEGYKLMEKYCIGELIENDRRFK